MLSPRPVDRPFLDEESEWSMLKHLTPLFAITVWLLMVAVAVLVAATMGTQLTIATGTLLAVACIVPPSVVMMVWRGAPPPTVAEVLNDVDRRV